jgi:hypothetical protein
VPVDEHCGPTDKELAAYWVGLGSSEPGGITKHVLEQIGTVSGCDPYFPGVVTHQAFYEILPGDGPHFLPSPYRVDAGDDLHAGVRYDKGAYTLSLTNKTHEWNSSITLHPHQPEGALSSAEWIVESPPTFTGPSTLLPFGTIHFEHYLANGTPIASTPNTSNLTMKDTYGKDRARPGDLDDQHISFAVTWLSGGP